MANATITARSSTYNGDFTVNVGFESDVTGFDRTDINIVAVSGNGVTGVDYFISGSGDSYNVFFTLPENHTGSFTMDITGMVTPEDSSQAEAVVATAVTLSYDTAQSVTAVFGTPVHHAKSSNFQVDVSIAFQRMDMSPELVRFFAKTDIDLIQVAGDVIYDFDYFLTGQGAAYLLSIVPVVDRFGVLRAEITGDIFKESTMVREQVEETPVLIPYNARIPQIVEYESPPELTAGTWDVRWDLDFPDFGFDADDGFLYEGDAVDDLDLENNPPVIYRARSLDVRPVTPAAPVDPSDPPECVGDWVLERGGISRVPAKFFLIRFNIPSGVSGSLNVYPKPDTFLPMSP